MKKTIALIIPNLLLGTISMNMVGCSQKITYKQLDIISFQPFYKDPISTSVEAWALPDGIDTYNNLIKAAGDSLESNINTISYKDDDCSKDEVLTSEFFKKLKPNQIILFEGHGSFEHFEYGGDPYMHSVMWTGKTFDRSDQDPDVLNSRIIKAENNHEALTLYFVDEYVEDLTGSIVYLGNCFSGRECTFAQSFINKGAAAVIGNSDTTQSAYNSLIEYTTIKKLGEINPNTHLPYTIYEALEFAKGLYGRNDYEKSGFAAGSEPILYGDPNYRICE